MVLLFGIGTTAKETNTSESKNGQVLILANPSRVRMIGLVDPNIAGSYTNASVFEVKLTNIRVVAGTFSDKSLVVNLTGTHAGVFRKRRDIYVLLNVGNGPPKGLYWGDLYSLACVPKDLVDDSSLKAELELSEPSGWRDRERVCAAIDS